MQRASLVLRAVAGSAVLLLAAACSSTSTTSRNETPTGAAAPSTPAASASAPAGQAAACGNATAPTVAGSGPADTAGAANKIAADYAQFFDPATAVSAKMGLLQNADKLAPAMQAFAGDPQAAQTTVAVTGVDFTSATTADVTYNVCLSGAVALNGSKGKSVLDGGVWKVGDTTLCGLLQLKAGSSPVPGCS
ncbi:hypothetical protein [Streptacidiphilus neutrinimicus]|uniref:hypothetical protein n=1 Tax=Streptacidiphilus neutrinimicus TaxID=105420 RepID=UPI0005AB60B3|nr:hypothetical protein [Streptacidiphilus neutrinimicus]